MLYFLTKRHKDRLLGLIFCFYVFMSDVLMLGVGSAWSLSQLRSFFPEVWRLINPSCGQLRYPCMGLQLSALLCSELAELPLPIGRCGLGSLRPMAAGRLKSDSHMQAPHRGAQLVVTASQPLHWPRSGQTMPQTHRSSPPRHHRATSAPPRLPNI